MRKGETYKSTCSYCGVGCGLLVNKNKNGQIKVQGDPDHPVNKGMLCSKGMNLHYVANNKEDRILHPTIRWGKNHPLERTDWSTAMQRAAAVFRSIIQKHGPDAVAFYVSGQCLTEEYYIANKLVKGFIGTNNIDTNSRLCMSSAVAGYVKTMGEDAVPISYEDIELCDTFFIAGANPAWCHPILFRRLEQHKARNPHVKIITVDPRQTQTAGYSDLHLQIFPGTDIYLYNAIAKVLIVENKYDKDFVEKHCKGFSSYWESLSQLNVEDTARICGVSLSDIHQAASWIGDAKGFITMWAMGLNQSVIGVKKNLALISLNLITGKIGKPGSGPFSLTGQPNAMGGREVGGMATLLAAHFDLANAEHRKHVSHFWKSKPISPHTGLTATKMVDALLEGKLKAVWIVCTNPLVSLPNARLAEEALKKAKFVVVQDISQKNEAIPYADLVLPAAGCFEKEGTMTNSERRISHLSKAIEPPGEALPDVEILCKFAKAMGYPGFDYAATSEIFHEYTRLTQGTHIDISGLNYARLRSEGTFQWPVPHPDHSGTERLFTDNKFYTPSGKAQFYPLPQMANLSEKTTSEHPLVLTTGRIRDQWHTMTKTGKVKRLQQHIERPFLEIHPNDALIRGIENDDMVTVFNNRGSVTSKVKITNSIKEGVVFLPMHWGKLFGSDLPRANNLTSNLIDPVSSEPDYKFSVVEVSKLEKKQERIIIVGAGAAAYAFVSKYREKNKKDKILVFSKEKHAFYNRVLLPEYINNHLKWNNLLKSDQADLKSLDIDLFTERTISTINKETKTVTDNLGISYGYDKLILATGSAPFIPKEINIKAHNNIFVVRTKWDADKLKDALPNKSHVLIIGGGLLGLELAAALHELELDISLVQLPSRLMIRQLDQTSGDLLKEEMEERGINVYCNEQVVHLGNEEGPMNVKLKSGRTIKADIVVVAVGTRPNIELAQKAQIQCGRGILVNQYLQSSDPDIYAIGEIAEYNGDLYGTTAAAEQQAHVLAKHFMGDNFSHYTGSVKLNILKFSDLDLCSVGMHEAPESEDGYEEIIFLDKSRRYYKKCIVKDDVLMGAILMGDKNEFALFREYIETGIELADNRTTLLRSSEPEKPVVGKLVCSCNRVGEGTIKELLDNGVDNLDDICKNSGAGLGCGSCKTEIRGLILSHQSQLETILK